MEDKGLGREIIFIDEEKKLNQFNDQTNYNRITSKNEPGWGISRRLVTRY